MTNSNKQNGLIRIFPFQKKESEIDFKNLLGRVTKKLFLYEDVECDIKMICAYTSDGGNVAIKYWNTCVCCEKFVLRKVVSIEHITRAIEKHHMKLVKIFDVSSDQKTEYSQSTLEALK